MGKRSVEREQFLADILITAVEGGVGYWSQCQDYHWFMDFGDGNSGTAETVADTRVTLFDTEADPQDRGKPLHVTLETIAKGLGIVTKGDAVNSSMTANIRQADRENDCGLIDSCDCDAIVQAGLFGEVVYG